MRVDKPETWQPVVAELRRRKYVIADPDKTPHSSDDLIVFDLAGADQSAIEAGCARARDKGLVKIERIIREGARQAVHVELSLTQRGIQELRLRQPVAASGSSSSDDERKEGMRRLIDLHEQQHNILIVVTHSTQLASLLPIRFELTNTRLQRIDRSPSW